MSSLSQFGGNKPLRTVTYTSGTGMFTQLVSNSWCRVTVVGAGQGGGKQPANIDSGAGGGSPGAVGVFWMRVPAGLPYVIGAGGLGATGTTQGAAGGTTAFGSATAPAGAVAGSLNITINGSTAGLNSSGAINTWLGAGFMSGSSGSGFSGAAGGTPPGGGTGGSASGSRGGGGGGGASIYGAGGNGGAGNAAGVGVAGTNASGYGSGGGGGGAGDVANVGGNGGNGSGGLIIIEEFGA